MSYFIPLREGEALEVDSWYYLVTDSGSRIRGRYMGADYAERYLFDLRPKAGTTTVDPRDIKSINRCNKPAWAK